MSTNEVGPNETDPAGDAEGTDGDDMVSEYSAEESAGGVLGSGNLGDGDVDGIGDDGAADDGMSTAMGGPA